MYFVNMVDDVNEGDVFQRELTVPYIASCLDSSYEGKFVVKDGSVQFVGDDEDGENIFNRGFRGDPNAIYNANFSKYIKFKDVIDTEENKLIVVLCNSIGIYQGVDANIKIMLIDENHMLAALVYGACEFNGVCLKRTCTKAVEGRAICKVVTPKMVRNLMLVRDTVSDYDMKMDSVFQLVFGQANDGSFRVKHFTDGQYILRVEGMMVAREEKRVQTEKANKAKEEARLRKEREAAEFAKFQKEKAERLEAEKEQEREAAEVKRLAKEERAKNKAGKVEKGEILLGGGEGQSRGAAAFMAAVMAARR